MKKVTIIVLQLAICTLLSINAYASNEISFHLVKEECQSCSLDKYTQGKEVFPDYKFHWLSDEFLIKKEPSLILRADDIEKIEIEPNVSQAFNIITLFLTNNAGELLKKYTEESIGEKISLQIGDTILTLVTIQFVLENDFSFVVRKYSKDFIVNELAVLTRQIIIK